MKPRRDRDSKRPTKQVGSTATQNSDTMAPIFAFEKMQDGSGYSINCCSDGERAAALKQLFLLSQSSWNQIKNAPRHGIGSEKIARSAFRVALPPSITEDVTLLALRYNGMKPMIGYRDGRIFQIIYFDHDFSVYDHG